MTRAVGLIGGMSWQTTSLYYKAINERVNHRLGGIHSPNLLIRSLDYADIGRLVAARDYDGMTELLCDAGHSLQRAGAQSLALCANVAHRAADVLERTSGLPVLHIVDFTGQAIVQRGLRKVGLLATRAVMEEEFYKARLRDRYHLEVAVPEGPFGAQVDRLIFDELSKPHIAPEVRAIFQRACEDLVQNQKVDCIVLGCTELRLVFDVGDMEVPVFETTTLHAQGIADWALEN
ncbi:aspartate racemase [Aspergillus bertholletiae]|uniref:Aspartate racemase n=1 Tax=Aspergillus bertholletiae TaxID=1226010 RepID=A0A5N7B939_9EURO|nr:aspartate racemase [Aspergillus bertholletiae]